MAVVPAPVAALAAVAVPDAVVPDTALSRRLFPFVRELQCIGGIDVRAALTRAHSDAIENLIVKLTAETITSLGASVRSTNIGTLGPGDDIITIEYDVAHHDASVACLRTNIETAIAYGVLARATAGTALPLAQWYSTLAHTAALPVDRRIKRSA